MCTGINIYILFPFHCVPACFRLRTSKKRVLLLPLLRLRTFALPPLLLLKDRTRVIVSRQSHLPRIIIAGL